MDFKPLEYIYIPAAKSGVPTLLLLHGTGGDERDLLPLAKNFGNGFNVLSVRGNVLESGMPRFFKRIGMGVFDEKDLEFRANELVDFLQHLSKEKGFDISKIIALGYSNGANIAGAVLNLQPDFFAGAILYRPMLPFQNKPFGSVKNSKPIFTSSGKNDPMVNSSDVKNHVSLLKSAGFEVADFEINTGHNLTQDDLDLSAKWFDKNFAEQPADSI